MEAGTIIEAGTPLSQRFSLRETSRILELPEPKLRSLARAGLLAPQRGPIGPLSFGFQDLLVLRTTQRLVASGVPMKRIRRTWGSLRRRLDAGLPLDGITIEADGDEVVASDGVAKWRPDSGQFLLDFDAADLVERAAEPAPSPAAPVEPASPGTRRPRFALIMGGAGAGLGAPEPGMPPHPAPRPVAIDAPLRAVPAEVAEEHELTAEEWYELGCELEFDSAERAREAYAHALGLDPDLTDAHVNLGRSWHVAGERGRAEPHYREAVRLAPDDPTPHFNLGVLLDEGGRKEEAIHAYRQAIARDAEFADAHCNLGLLLESLGRRTEAMRHLMVARQLSGEEE